MTKKNLETSKEDNGRSFIELEMDELRVLRWDFRAMQKFENRARDLLRRNDLLPQGMPVTTGAVLAGFLKMSDILEAAVGAACNLSSISKKEGECSEAANAIQAYLDKGGSLEQLQESLYESYLVVNDPFSISVWKENLARLREMDAARTAKANAELEIAQAEMREAQAKAKKARSGKEQPG